jgi:hypothetical protein
MEWVVPKDLVLQRLCKRMVKMIVYLYSFLLVTSWVGAPVLAIITGDWRCLLMWMVTLLSLIGVYYES